MTVKVSKLESSDWSQYRSLRLEALRTEPQAFGSSYEDNARRPDAWWKGRLEEAALGTQSWLLFAQSGDRLVGMIGAYIQDEPGSAEIISMYVSPGERGKGIAKALMTGLLESLRGSGRIRQVSLTVNADQEAALALYRSFGFRECGEAETVMGDGKSHHELVLSRTL